jgi:hypothetical protein
MKQLLFVAAAAAAISFAIPASAQVSVGVGERGVGVRIGEPGYVHRDRGWRHRHVYGASNCRTIRERIIRPSGRVVFKTTRVCG